MNIVTLKELATETAAVFKDEFPGEAPNRTWLAEAASIDGIPLAQREVYFAAVHAALSGPRFDPAISTDANLTAFGYQHTDAGNYRHDVVDAQGVVVFTGSVYQVNDWLRAGAPVAGQNS